MSSASNDSVIKLLQQLIATPSFSREESNTADVLATFLSQHGVNVRRTKNNVWTTNVNFDPSKPTLLLNSHHDTVKPNEGYTRNPFLPSLEDGKLYGLGSNDAGGALVSLIATFLFFNTKPRLKWNLVLVASAEEDRPPRLRRSICRPKRRAIARSRASSCA